MIIKNILQLLELDDYYGYSRNIDIAKGLYDVPRDIKQAYKQGKRLGYGN